MPYRKKSYPSAKSERKWLCETYGTDFCKSFEAWCDLIVEFAPKDPSKLFLIPLEEVLDDAKSPWAHVWSTLKDQTIVDRLRSLIAFLKKQAPPYVMYAVHVRLLAQDRFWVNVDTVVHVDHVKEEVVFVEYHWYGDG